MSYEGYSQFLCKNGHYWTLDCYQAEGDAKCPNCECRAVWENMVDTTNGSWEGKKRIDNYVRLRVKKRRICKHCKSILETQYHIPKKGKRYEDKR